MRTIVNAHDRKNAPIIDSVTMSIRFINHEPDGIKICCVEGESLVTVIVPREKLAEAKALPDLPYRSIYYLLDENHGVLSRVYAGQTTQGLARLDAHKARKEFWNKAVMFLDNDADVDRDVLDALETDAIEYVRSHGSYETENSATPSPRRDPYKEQRVARLHKSILFRMEALGYDLNRVFEGPTSGSDLFYTKKRSVLATGRYNKDTGQFTVLAGSQISLSRAIINYHAATDMRIKLFGNVSEDTVLTEDVSFTSPSTAAVFVLGGSQNGWTEWIDDTGRTLDAVYRKQKA